ncbi:MAG: CHAT domain-containing protein [candidate division KSB1 bacterium]|nr:CHAT domain-containing protein [candidate division KSB1 bacterium]
MKPKLILGIKLKTFLVGWLAFIIGSILLGLLFEIPWVHGLYETVETYCYFQLFVPTARPHEHLLIIDEGEQAYERAEYARLIAGLHRLDAKVIALDALFITERDSAQDAALIAATQAAADKVIHAIAFMNAEKHASIPDRFQLHINHSLPADHFIQIVYGALLPMQRLLDATRLLGAVTTSTDIAYRDDQYFPMILCYNETLYPSLPLVAVMTYLDIPFETGVILMDDQIVLQKNGYRWAIPINNRCQTLINFIPPEELAPKRISFSQALQYIDRADPLFRDKLVLIGNATEPKEQQPGPHFSFYPNLYVYASLISQILNHQFIREAILESLSMAFLLLTLSIIAMLFFREKFSWANKWYFYFIALGMMLLIAKLGFRFGMKFYIIVPFLILIFSHQVTRKYHDRWHRKAIQRPVLPLDFYIAINPRTAKSDSYPLTLIASPAGEDSAEMKLTMKPSTINKIREQMAQQFKLDMKQLKEFGGHLFNSLFQPRLRDQFEKSLGIAFSQKTALRIKLRIDAPDLACYPWEFLYDREQSHEFLALQRNVLITRFLAVQNPLAQVTTSPPLRMLVIIANPSDPQYPAIAAEQEKNLIKQALKQLVKQDLLRIRFLKPATLAGLERELTHRVDIVHFIGHGGYCEALGGGCLVFETEDGKPELLSIERLSTLMDGAQVRLVVLNACQTATIANSDISFGVAHGLVKIGIPAVVAMQFNIPDASALMFAKHFYTTLAETHQVDRAVDEARRRLFVNLESGRIDWGIPVLFMRKDDGVIF